ncbi:WD40-repeat-containing domain protein [Kockovaella imperatae]|uniref:WD40-repeat-containing domain protein n=1 Tax=Kockovaella imperatae TaxID=4999 RepID=A0A1Y1U7H2_9TREE|nr:WD40-repeat-containing domain protein [Kockovaella imperatae]ORX33958.1 WD40-repeat-containing domain protein [Kockovaella imperatae]
MSGTLISSLAWVPRGKASLEPKKYTLDENELQRVGKLGGPGALEKLREEMAGLDMDGDDWEDVDDGTSSSGASGDVPMDTEDMSAFKMDEYDKEESTGVAMGAFANVKGLTFYRDNEEDPYITLKEDEDDTEELALRPTDAMIITARTTSDLSSLDFHVYDDPNENLFVHHDLMLPSFPLCVEWLDFDSSAPSSSSNSVAVGGFDPTIEIWDADMVDGLYPNAILGPAPGTERDLKPKGTGKKKRKQVQSEPDYHTDAVIALSWTPNHRHLLLSGSADATIKLWDLSRESPMAATKSWDKIHKGEKVQAVEWNRSSTLDKAVLSAGYDRMVQVWDSRAPDQGVGTNVGCDVEAVRWDPHEPTAFFVSLENGLILAYDSRNLERPKYRLSAHESGASGLDINPHIRGCIATGGMDKLVKVWNVSDEETDGVQGRKREISLVTSRDLGVGKVFTTRWCPDPETPLTLAAAGSKAALQIWDVASNPGARKAFGERLKRHGRSLGEIKQSGGVVGVDEDSEDEE